MGCPTVVVAFQSRKCGNCDALQLQAADVTPVILRLNCSSVAMSIGSDITQPLSQFRDVLEATVFEPRGQGHDKQILSLELSLNARTVLKHSIYE